MHLTITLSKLSKHSKPFHNLESPFASTVSKDTHMHIHIHIHSLRSFADPCLAFCNILLYREETLVGDLKSGKLQRATIIQYTSNVELSNACRRLLHYCPILRPDRMAYQENAGNLFRAFVSPRLRRKGNPYIEAEHRETLDDDDD